ncbi:hypothetical protein T07_11037 [Trichinella nelsoni]|uniref:Uncharacterized protein n=1 Tax=Trichinella nelsoni TaxID=6336 RepID=A0A0V0SLU5_9BILA|nr:hypothetical protein T07_11037 [Trichinella nelsoni]
MQNVQCNLKFIKTELNGRRKKGFCRQREGTCPSVFRILQCTVATRVSSLGWLVSIDGYRDGSGVQHGYGWIVERIRLSCLSMRKNYSPPRSRANEPVVLFVTFWSYELMSWR